ncbi:MAG: amidase family protein [Fidelibacterota bacterium]
MRHQRLTHFRSSIFFFLLLLAMTCNNQPKTTIPPWQPYDESAEIAENADHDSKKMQFKLIQSRIFDKNEIWKQIGPQIEDFSEADYQKLKPLILEQDIPTLQSHIKAGRFSYEKLTQWCLFRIVKFENDCSKYLNGIISINPEAVAMARQRDKNRSEKDHPIYGMPVILKDNINFAGLPTTGGAYALLENNADNAFITDRIQKKGGIILGKANLSEWANYLSKHCPNGYSAVGGQTLNPYGRKEFDTGGSSSGSGVSIAANYAAAAVGTETSGSILSPSSSNSIIGLKPTVGLLSRSGIIPISSTLDTPGPMTRTVIDNAILLSAMTGYDDTDPAMTEDYDSGVHFSGLEKHTLKGLRLGVNREFLEDSLYQQALKQIKQSGAETVVFDPEEMDFNGFITLLDSDMKVDLPAYLENYASENIHHRSIADLVAYNQQDTTLRIPYGQTYFEGMVRQDISESELTALKKRFHEAAVKFFEIPMKKYKLDAVLSINNWNAGHAALAKYPCLTIPMGYKESGQPMGLTFIARPFEENKLLKMGYAFEKETMARKLPAVYKN